MLAFAVSRGFLFRADWARGPWSTSPSNGHPGLGVGACSGEPPPLARSVTAGQGGTRSCPARLEYLFGVSDQVSHGSRQSAFGLSGRGRRSEVFNRAEALLLKLHDVRDSDQLGFDAE